MNERTARTRGTFGSRLGFIFTAAGSAIGLGNIWRFPYMAGEGGGAAFVLLYLCFVLLLGFPVMLAELSIGQATHQSGSRAFEALAPGTRWRWIGTLGVLTGLAILAFYSVVAGWALGYLFKAARGHFIQGITPETSAQTFASFIAAPGTSCAMTAVVIAITAGIVLKGISKGIERASLILMPLFFVLLLGLAVHSLLLPGAGPGLAFLFEPEASKISLSVLMGALGQAFFSLSLGMGVMITYSSYLTQRQGLAGMALSSIAADTSVAMLAGIILFPAIFTVGASPRGGPGLAFITFPTIFADLPAGTAMAIAFYALLSIASLTSTVSLLEVVVAHGMDRFGWKRSRTAIGASLTTLLIALPCALSFGGNRRLTELFGIEDGFFGLLNIAFGNFALVIGALFICLFVGWRWGTGPALAALGMEARSPLAHLLRLEIRYLCPLAIAAVLGFITLTGKFF